MEAVVRGAYSASWYIWNKSAIKLFVGYGVRLAINGLAFFQGPTNYTDEGTSSPEQLANRFVVVA